MTDHLGIDPVRLAEALRADGYHDAPTIDSLWVDGRWTWLDAGQRRLARVGGVWKTVDGWSVNFHAWTDPDESEDDQNSGTVGVMMLNQFMSDFAPVGGAS